MRSLSVKNVSLFSLPMNLRGLGYMDVGLKYGDEGDILDEKRLIPGGLS